jgi:ABC-2 type transport system ATP-binding protein
VIIDAMTQKVRSSDRGVVWTGGDVVVTTIGLTRRFGDFAAVDHVDLEIRHGEVFGLLGRNGAGKTTMIKMLITLLAPSEGTATIAGFDLLTQASRVRRVIGYVPQMISADPSLTAWENLSVFARPYHVPRSQRRARTEEALAFMGLEPAAHQLVRDFSGGMVRRLEIAQSMLHQPAVLFLDEPTVGLDPAARHAVLDELRRVIAARGTTLVLTTHDMQEADELCDQVAIMHHGRIVVEGTPTELKATIGPDATLDDVFIAYGGEAEESEGGFREAARTRRAIGRLG